MTTRAAPSPRGFSRESRRLVGVTIKSHPLGYVLAGRRRFAPAPDVQIGQRSSRSTRTDTQEGTWTTPWNLVLPGAAADASTPPIGASLHPTPSRNLRRGLFDVAASVVAYLGLTAAMYAAFGLSLLLVVVLAVPAAGYLMRTCVVFHDCAHGCFLRRGVRDRWLGIAYGLVGLFALSHRRHGHAMHHASAGDLDRRGRGDVGTLTVAEQARCHDRSDSRTGPSATRW